MSFRTPEEAVALANNTEYGLAASIWSESINLALDIAPKLKAGVVWVNSTNLFDACAGLRRLQGIRLRPRGRARGRARLHQAGVDEVGEEACRGEPPPSPSSASNWSAAASTAPRSSISAASRRGPTAAIRAPVAAANGKLVGEVGDGNRKDIRDAVEAARKIAPKWASATEHNRAQILYYIAENLDARASEFADRLRALKGVKKAKTRLEVDAAIERLFAWGAWADKYEGAVHKPPFRGLALAMNEPIGVVGIVCPGGAGPARASSR